jgi:hypothetical protein
MSRNVMKVTCKKQSQTVFTREDFILLLQLVSPVLSEFHVLFEYNEAKAS